MRLFRYASLFFLFFVHLNALRAEWNPLYLPKESTYTLQAVHDPALLALEKQVFEYGKNSWCSQEKAQLIMELIAIVHPEVCVEVGAFTGSTALPILAGLQYFGKGSTYIIDAWSNEEAVRGLPRDDPNTAWWASLNMGAVKYHFYHMINSWSISSPYEILEMTSARAVNLLPSIDFLHLDGNFSEAGALADSELYLPKVSPGGYILLSNALVMIGGKATKMRALWPLFEYCDIVCEIDQGNTLLFRKHQH